MERIGRFEVVSHLATGGMGQVYLARATGLGGFERQVVVKTLEAERDEDDSLVRMFLDEARLVGSLHHQYIAPVYEVGCDENGRYFLVMDYVRGETAQAVWKAARAAGGPPPLACALSVVSAVASALDYAHALRAPDGTPLEIVHRDVSLSNIMVGHDGAVKLIDFGIAKFARRTTNTQIGSLKGKIAYLAPEQVLSQPVDRRADIFALGIVLYELTTNAVAFDGDSELLTMEKITKGEVRPPWQIVPGYPRELERIVMKALAVDRDLRYSDAGTMGRELEAFAVRAGLPLGHAAIRDVMAKLFDPAAPGGRRRFARASSQPDSAKIVAAEVDDIDITPVFAAELDDATTVQPPRPEDLDPPTEPLMARAPSPGRDRLSRPTAPQVPSALPTAPQLAVARATLAGVPAVPVRTRPPSPVPSPLVVRIGTPPPTGEPKPITVTGQLRRLPTAPSRGWWWPLALIGLALGVALAVALL